MKLTWVMQNVLCSAVLSACIQMPGADSFYDVPMGVYCDVKSSHHGTYSSWKTLERCVQQQELWVPVKDY